MSIKRCAQFALLVCLLPLLAHGQEQGQYRSRIMLDPLGELSKGSEMSIEELQQEIDSIDDPYARASAGRHLARHHVQQGDYPAAIAYYRGALDAGGLAPPANREMLRELAQVYLLQKDYRQAAATLEQALAIELAADAADYLLLARARHELGDYVAVVDSLDRIPAAGLVLDTGQKKQALALYYRAGAWEQCAVLLQQLQEAEPQQASYWHQLASVYLQQGDQRRAQDVLVLARHKGVAFRADELQLLVDLLAVNGNPYGAAQTLQRAIDKGELANDAGNQRKLFELWLQARERDAAQASLARAARLSGDTELYLHLAQLQMEEEEWQAMEQTLGLACGQQLADRYVSRANLLLGVSQFELGNVPGARRAFINATLVGGAHEQAAQWLAFMEAAPATEDELRRVQGPCYGSTGRAGQLPTVHTAVAAVEAAPATIDAMPAPGPVLDELIIKTQVPARWFYMEIELPQQDPAATLQGQVLRLGSSLVKAGGSADGDPLLVRPAEGADWQLALPYRGSPQPRGRYRTRRSDEFRYVMARYQPGATGLMAAQEALAAAAVNAGHRLSGERRLVLLPQDGQAGRQLEIQLGLQ